MAVISSAVRNNLLALTNTTAQQAVSQNRLATGKKVNSALDNPTNFFTAQSLSSRASGLSSLLDGMSTGIKTLEAADNGMKAITKNIESMQANIRSARSDKSFKGESRTISDTAAGNLTFSGGALGTAPDVSVDVGTYKGVLTGTAFTALDFRGDGADTTANTADDTNGKLDFNIKLDGGSNVAVTVESTSDTNLKIKVGTTTVETNAVVNADSVTDAEMAATLTAGFKAAGVGIEASVDTGKLVFKAAKGIADKTAAAIAVTGVTPTGGGSALTAANFGFAAGVATTVAGQGKTVDELVKVITDTTALTGKVRATNDGGKLRIENLGTTEMTVTGMSATAVNGGTGASNQTKIGGNEVRKNLISQFNDLRTQLDKLAGDASFNGINLLKADKLKLTFNEDGTNNIEIQAKDTAGTVRAIDTSEKSLNIGAATDAEFSDDSKLDARLDALSKAVTTLNTQSSTFGSALTTIQTRQDFTKSMINTLQAGADSLVNADLNEESATLLALNTRQQLSQTALSLASQADQAVLRLF
jgi:flagellin-like hook-associated protein FlgL